MDARAGEEIRLLQYTGVLGAESTMVDLGAGSGQFALAVAHVCERVVAVDVSPVMLERLRQKLAARQLANVETIDAGFLSYEHAGGPGDVVYSRYALHHLPDFWQALALRRIAGMLRPGGVFRVWDVVYGFDAADAERRIEAWIAETMAADVDGAGPAPSLPSTCAPSTRRSPGSGFSYFDEM